MAIDPEIKSYVDDNLKRNMDEIRLFHQPMSHMIDTNPPLQNIGGDGHIRLLNAPTKKIYVKISGAWFSVPVS